MKRLTYLAIMSLFAAVLVTGCVGSAYADTWYVCSNGTDRAVFEDYCPPGWWIVEVLAG